MQSTPWSQKYLGNREFQLIIQTSLDECDIIAISADAWEIRICCNICNVVTQQQDLRAGTDNNGIMEVPLI